MMTIYIRKVTKSKWDWRNPVNGNVAANALGTDGVTNCCRTSENTLSIWKVDSENLDSEDDKKVVASLVTNGGSLSSIDCIFLSDEDLEECGLSVSQKDGDSFISDIKSKHYNIIDLNMSSVSALGLIIKKKISGVQDGNVVTQTAKLKKIDLGSIRSYIRKYIPQETTEGATLKLKSGFSKVYD
ncbi:hypothetical protein L1D04_03530 [Klebsiella pneumoniae]|uniref:hypothetical protein n=1 Tax=Klebsiella pneumoniae TaxID=573 RepID=UPI0011DE4471|nr:hypothetical protein [Klebsiella pneumoniae]HCT5345661.1 hypothetical protein [Klebsiella quasipneumoniae]EIW8530637.1 hypothetical protein [Klebsiella pneumoniae]MBG1742315.1 hypothetical protein [Klebsiella pneumoniae]MBG1767869.1 hypothetical protein [Klebsiella pneumoniae]MBZ1588199.1 hypothetical protein [Klebsiella pneumoniae]